MPSNRILLVDNYDSFTYNLKEYISLLGVDTEVITQDTNIDDVKISRFAAIILSPGPNSPKEAGNLLDVIDRFHKRIPILGICLGHQGLAAYFGGKLEKSKFPRHGKKTLLNFSENDPIFRNINVETYVVRYNSLTVSDPGSEFDVIARESGSNDIQAIRHKSLPLIGLQFHPEAILTEHGLLMLRNWKDQGFGCER